MDGEQEDMVSRGPQADAGVGLRVEQAAIRIGRTVFTLPRPNRHHNIMWWLSTLGVSSGQMHDQGFLLSNGLYATRDDAAKLALGNSQVQALIAPPNLYSEDLWEGGADMASPTALRALAFGDCEGHGTEQPLNADEGPGTDPKPFNSAAGEVGK